LREGLQSRAAKSTPANLAGDEHRALLVAPLGDKDHLNIVGCALQRSVLIFKVDELGQADRKGMIGTVEADPQFGARTDFSRLNSK
jgi:hypothetical protein